MAYVQTRAFDKSQAGTVLGMCLRNNRLGYGIQAKYPNAIGAWNHTQQHKDRNFPAGVTVPLYYSWLTDGHINERFPDGTIWNDGRMYSSLAVFLSTAPISPKPVYLGWGESINDVRVIENKGDVNDMPNEGDVHNAYLQANGRKATAEEVRIYTSKTWGAVDGLYYGKVRNDYENTKNALKTCESNVKPVDVQVNGVPYEPKD
jgi:hypothetical protein